MRSVLVARPASSPQSLVIFRLAATASSDDARQPIAFRFGGGFPDAGGEVHATADVATAVGLDVADDQDEDGVVGEDRPQPGEDVAHEGEVRLAVMGVVERRVDGAGIEPEEPRPQPVVVAVLHDPEVRRRGHHQPGTLRAPATTESGAGARRQVPGVTEQGDPLDRWRRLAEEPVELLGEPVEHVALRRGERGPCRVVAHVARRHRERVRHQHRQVARALAVEDAGDGGGQEAVGPVVEPERGPDEQELAERPRVERQGDLDRDVFDAIGVRVARPGARDQGCRGVGRRPDPFGEGQPAGGGRVPGQPELGQSRRRLRARRRLDLGRGQQVGERVEVVADADPALRAGLERGRAAPGERVEDDVTRPRIAGDERMGEGRREAREIRAHRMEGVAPQPLLVLPLGGEGECRQLGRQFERELTRGDVRRTCRHRRSRTSLSLRRSRSVRWVAEHSTRNSGFRGPQAE